MNPTPKPASRAAARAASLVFAETYVPESEPIIVAREAAKRLGIASVSQGVATALTFLTRALRAKAVVEIGTGAGVSGLALMAGMVDDGILTSIDSESEHQLAARKALAAAKIAPRRMRLIAGEALSVLPKLTDGAYDLVFIDGDPLEYVEYVAQALRLLRRGGIVVLHHVFWDDLVADPTNEDDETVIIREALAAITDIEEFCKIVIPLGDGLLAAVKA